MCLEVVATIASDAKGRISARRLSELSGLSVSSCRFEDKPALHFSVSGGCSCEFLSEDAEFEAESWSLAAAHLPALSKAVVALGSKCERFSFIAHWLNGVRSRRAEQVSAAALCELVAANRVGNNVRYVVG
jgi:hypothetical protein